MPQENNDEEYDETDYDEEDYKTKLKEYEERFIVYQQEAEKHSKYLEAYRIEVAKVIDKSNDMYEKQIIYVAAGTLAASVLIVEKFLPNIRIGFYYLLLSWAFCGATIIVNMLSHYINMMILPKTIDELDAAEAAEFNPDKANRRRRIVEIINGATLLIYAVGLGLFVTYIVKNLDNMNNDKSTKVSNTPDQTKGYQLNTTVSPKPVPPTPPPPPTKPKS